jgi:hypothetical protein
MRPRSAIHRRCASRCVGAVSAASLGTALERCGTTAASGCRAQLAAHAEAFCRRVREGLAEADFERKRTLLELLVDRVVVTDGAAEIRYVVPTGPEGENAPFSRLRTDYRPGATAPLTAETVQNLGVRRMGTSQP